MSGKPFTDSCLDDYTLTLWHLGFLTAVLLESFHIFNSQTRLVYNYLKLFLQCFFNFIYVVIMGVAMVTPTSVIMLLCDR